ncbi:MAG: flagellar protein FlaG [Lachnospiraceae bacterium]|nr:flagellar protein FlaG [Lachnospiraceae bacterium]
MAIEPINSIMTMQAQSIQPANNTTKSAMEYTDVSIAENAPKVDETTKVVENVDEKDSNFNRENQQPSNEQLHKAVEDLNKKMSNSEAVFGIHEGTNRVTIKIVDKKSKEVIKELPPEKTLDMIARVWEMAGLLVDERR